MIEFTPWPKIARLNRDITITEKIDGTNAAVGIAVVPLGEVSELPATYVGLRHNNEGEADGSVIVYAQSRKKLITPSTDSHGFARWVWNNADVLAKVLGPGIHFGEWWGAGIQRGYGLPKGDKRFSLFNTKRWGHPESGLWDEAQLPVLEALGHVPVLYDGPFQREGTYESPWYDALDDLEKFGSQAAPGFMRPEGIVIYHKAANMMFKVTLENDEVPKFLQERGIEE